MIKLIEINGTPIRIRQYTPPPRSDRRVEWAASRDSDGDGPLVPCGIGETEQAAIEALRLLLEDIEEQQVTRKARGTERSDAVAAQIANRKQLSVDDAYAIMDAWAFENGMHPPNLGGLEGFTGWPRDKQEAHLERLKKDLIRSYRVTQEFRAEARARKAFPRPRTWGEIWDVFKLIAWALAIIVAIIWLLFLIGSHEGVVPCTRGTPHGC